MRRSQAAVESSQRGIETEMDPNAIAPPGADWFEIIWGSAWALLMAVGAAVWKTKASREDVTRSEQNARDYTDRIVRTVLHEMDNRYRSDMADFRNDIRTQVAEMRQDIKRLLEMQGHRGGSR